MEAAHLDESYDEVERHAVVHVLKQEFELSDEECDTLIEQAEAVQHEATDLYRFIRKFDSNFGHAERLRLIEMLWQVVYADGSIHEYEANLVRRTAGLLYVSDKEVGLARKKVTEHLDIGSNAA